jgi:hypothetical protein
LDGVINKMIEYLKVYEQEKVTSEDSKKVEGFKNGAIMVVRGINERRECIVAAGRMAAKRQELIEGSKDGPNKKTA